MDNLDQQAQELAKRLHAFRHSLLNSKKSIAEEPSVYEINEF
jgi:hypothetical protein